MNIKLEYDSNNTVISYASAELKAHISLLELPISFFDNNNYLCDYTIRLGIQQDLSSYGLSPVADFAVDDQYVCHWEKEQGLILGTNSRSVLLGVYALLRKLGFRFLRPDKHGTVVPAINSVDAVFAELACSAAIRHRGVCIEGANSLENILNFVAWLPKLGYNSFFMQFKTPYVFLQRWSEHILNPLAPSTPLSEEACRDADEQITAAMNLRGLLQHRVGHGWTVEAIGRSCLGWQQDLTPPEPEIQPLLAMIDGKRVFYNGVPANTNLCYSNPEVIERLANCVADYAKENPSIHYLHVWLADECNNVCECDECAKTTPADQYVEILNHIDRTLSTRGLSTRIVFLLYQELLFPPVQARLQNPERFLMMFAPISRSFEKSYPTSPREISLPAYCRNKIQLPVDIEENLAHLRAWQHIFSGDSFVYDYPLGRAHYGDSGYMKISRVLYHDIRSLPNLGVNGYISCQELRVLSPTALPNYVMGLALFDSSLSFEAIADEYFSAAFGAQSHEVQSYLDSISTLSNTDYFNGKTSRNDPEQSKAYEKLTLQLQNFVPAIARIRAECNPFQQFFWNLLDYHAAYSILLTQALAALACGEIAAANAMFQQFQIFICEHEPLHQASLDVYRILEVSGKYTGFTLPG